MIFKWVILSLFMSLIIMMVASFFVKKEPSREMKSKFESGIDQMEQEHLPFYMHFFIVGVLFLIFDVEIVLCIPMVQSPLSETQWINFWLIFFLIIFAGLVLELCIDSVDWKE